MVNVRFLLLAFLLALVSHVEAWAISTSNDTLALEVDKSSLGNNIDSINGQQNALKLQNEILNSALNANSNIFSGISTYFAVISILLTIIVVVLPLINYFFV